MKNRTITVEWEDGDMNDHCFEMDVPENADEEGQKCDLYCKY